MNVRELSERMGLTVLCAGNPERPVAGGYCGDLLSWVMGRAPQNGAWITIMCNLNTVAVAVMADVSAVIFAEGVRPDVTVLDRARTEGVALLGGDQPAFELAGALSRLLERPQ